MKKYEPKEIEPKWQKIWEENGTFHAREDESKKKFYGLIEFPYPSGAGLHVGHPRPFTAIDVITRKKRMEGYNVLFPIGFDAFGLPTENYAIKMGKAPKDVTKENIANFTRQLTSLGFGFDWSRVVDTTDPAYYKWTQWIFLQLYKHGLAYKKNQPINWCPKDKIGLANEEVVTHSTSLGQAASCERCGGPVEKRNKEQWMLAITKYADSLLEGLKDVDYIERAKVQQENWIGKSEGATVKFSVINSQFSIEVFTTRPDTIFGATYMVVAPEHPIVQNLKSQISNFNVVEEYIENAKRKTDMERSALDKEKTGVELKGVKAINPATQEEIPIWMADYVLGNYGTGAIMAVPAHDERDFEFAKKYMLSVKQVVAPEITVTGDGAPRAGKELTRRDVVTIIIKDPATNKYLLLKRKDGHCQFVGGGVEDGETVIEAAHREITEESGYTNVHLYPDPIVFLYGYGYKGSKDFNCYDLDTVFFAELASDAQIAQSEEDRALHDIVWLDEKEIAAAITKDHHRFMWKCYEAKGVCITEEGGVVNSEFLNGLSTSDAKNKICSWLEEKGIGKRQVQYKLRDWVFSRQRYWGEPIPLVYCEHCATKKQKVLLIHGFEGSGEGNWFPWMKEKLEQEGFEVFAPTMSTSDHPTVDSWMKELQPYMDTFGEDDIIIGHSLGSKAALHLIERSGKKIGRLYLVASAIGKIAGRNWEQFVSDWPESDIGALRAFWETPVDYEKVSSCVGSINVIRSSDDPLIPASTHDALPRGWFVQVWNGFGHFQHHEQERLLGEILTSKVTGWVPLPESELPLTLPEVEKYQPTDTGESPLAAMTDWVKTTCPRCGGDARRETDTMPNWAGSSWYFLRYADPHNDKELASQEALKYWMSVDWYNGGMEHTVLHLLYSRFWNQFLYDIGVVPVREPYKKRTSHGMILAKGGEKMSKSKGNVVNPDEMVDQFGADALRAYIMFTGPFDQAVEWDTNGLVGVKRFLDRVWGLYTEQYTIASEETLKQLQSLLHKTIKKVTEDIDAMRFNTAVSTLMIMANALLDAKKESLQNTSVEDSHFEPNYIISTAGSEELNSIRKDFLKLLSPFAPHMAEELWRGFFQEKESITYAPWPVYEEKFLVADTMTIAVQVNGKLRDTIIVPSESVEDDIKKQACSTEKVVKHLNGHEPKKVIYVKGKLVSIVV